MKSQILDIISNSLTILRNNNDITQSDVKEITGIIYDKIKLQKERDIHTKTAQPKPSQVLNSFAGVNIQR